MRWDGMDGTGWVGMDGTKLGWDGMEQDRMDRMGWDRTGEDTRWGPTVLGQPPCAGASWSRPCPGAGLIDLYRRAGIASNRTGGAARSCQLRRRGWAAGQLCDALPAPPWHGAEPQPHPRSRIPGGGRGPRWVGRLRGGPRRGAGGPPSPGATCIPDFSSPASSREPRQLPPSCWASRGDTAPPCPSWHGGRGHVAVPAAPGTGQGCPASLPQLPRLPLPRFAACWHLLIKCKYAVGI